MVKEVFDGETQSNFTRSQVHHCYSHRSLVLKKSGTCLSFAELHVLFFLLTLCFYQSARKRSHILSHNLSVFIIGRDGIMEIWVDNIKVSTVLLLISKFVLFSLLSVPYILQRFLTISKFVLFCLVTCALYF